MKTCWWSCPLLASSSPSRWAPVLTWPSTTDLLRPRGLQEPAVPQELKEDTEELALNFTMVNNDLGEPQVVELKLGGKDIPVTSANHIAYILLVADYRLNKQIHPHCLAFPQGLPNILSLEWLLVFDQQEIQVLISGAQVPISLEDLKSFTNYYGGYSANHPVFKIFWRVVEGFTDEEKLKLLKFVTPLLGFQELYPAFCIHNGGSPQPAPA
ncbi:hypothetical protein GHT09_016421 [Marmota monax]|uniref:HECT-type E3 ubiquitin transferase n=1 Tax=Marmota monax TaxID=9995 RepID=A0A834QB22_MARMO|nr:hypothetical protein GHT09_016421 [Marmota monax]